MSSSSSESDAGEKIKNVHFHLIKSKEDQKETDKNCSYKQRLGDLIFNANFEAGNLGYVEQVDEYEYDLMIRPDVANPRHRIWFNFTVSNQLPNQCVVFTFVNLSSEIRLFYEGLTPVVRSRLNPNWLRLHEDQVFYYRSNLHGDSYVLSIAFRFTSYDDEHQFALFYPYSYTTLQNFIDRWSAETKRTKISKSSKIELKQQVDATRSSSCISPNLHRISSQKSTSSQRDDCVINDLHELRSQSQQGSRKNVANCSKRLCHNVDFKVEIICSTILNKSLYSLNIKPVPIKGVTFTTINKEKPTVLILCRSCGNLESGASLVCQGLTDYVLSDCLLAKVARQYINFTTIPMIDPDSVYAGNSRSDILGQSKVSKKIIKNNPFIYSQVELVKQLIERICYRSETGSRVIIINLQVNIHLIGSRVCGTYYRDFLRMERHLALPKLLSRFTDDFYLENCVFSSSKNQSGSKTVLNFNRFNKVDQYTLEVSPFAFYKRHLVERVYKEYNQTKYLALGKAIVYSLLELLRPGQENLPHCVEEILESFRPRAHDIDDLLLSIKNLKGHKVD